MSGKIKLNATSGGGSVSIKAPSTTTSNAAVELQLPVDDGSADTFLKTDGSGNLSFAAAGGGKLLQVQQTAKTDTASTNSNSEADLMTLAITPTASNSKILLFVDLKLGSSSNSTDPIIRLYRDSTQIYLGDASGNRGRVMFGADEYDSTNNAEWLLKCVQGNFLDTPTYTLGDTITYKIKWRIVDTSHTLYLNRTGADGNAVNYPRAASSIIAQEVGA